MTTTARHALPLIDATQAQKHVTHNDALALLDLLVQTRVLDKDLATPPASPAEGDAYLVAAAATGAWAGKTGQIALWLTGAWTFLPARSGWLVWVADEARLYGYDGTAWIDIVAALAIAPTVLNGLSRLGLNATADATNPVSFRLNNSLHTAKPVAESGTGDIRTTMSKEATANTASLVLQTNFSGRAEIGLTGSDDLAFKVSSDGSTWRTGLKVTASSGQVTVMGVIPAADNTYTLGASGARWSQIWAATATISTSDMRAKTAIAEDVPGLDFVRVLRPVTYRQREADGSGRPGLRDHCGFIAQEVRAALGPRDLALWTEDRDSGLQGLRYEEFIPVLTHAIQQLDRRLTELGARSGFDTP